MSEDGKSEKGQSNEKKQVKQGKAKFSLPNPLSIVSTFMKEGKKLRQAKRKAKEEAELNEMFKDATITGKDGVERNYNKGEETESKPKPEIVPLPEIHENYSKEILKSGDNDLEEDFRKLENVTLNVDTAKKYLSGEDLSKSESQRQLRDLIAQLRMKQSGEALQYSVEQQEIWNTKLSLPIRVQRPDVTKFIKIETDQEDKDLEASLGNQEQVAESQEKLNQSKEEAVVPAKSKGKDVRGRRLSALKKAVFNRKGKSKHDKEAGGRPDEKSGKSTGSFLRRF